MRRGGTSGGTAVGRLEVEKKETRGDRRHLPSFFIHPPYLRLFIHPETAHLGLHHLGVLPRRPRHLHPRPPIGSTGIGPQISRVQPAGLRSTTKIILEGVTPVTERRTAAGVTPCAVWAVRRLGSVRVRDTRECGTLPPETSQDTVRHRQ